ncbi:MAG TPA: HDOD domain-containing protein [Gammaproteobacteria bacterium]|nr:HDOD domain-containing protein [Gammaproteobacteria bacterium]
METSKIQNFLDELYVKHTLHTNVVSESTLQFSAYADSIKACAVKVVLFSDKQGPLLVAFPAKDGLDFDVLAKATKRNLKLDSGRKYKKQLHGFSIRNLPPFGRLFQMMTVIDERLKGYDAYLLDIDQGDCFIEVNRMGFETIVKGSIVKRFSQEIPAELKRKVALDENGNQNAETLLTPKVVETLLANGEGLPIMPDVGTRLVQLKGTNDFELEALVSLIESDPALSAKIISYASSSFFAYQGKLATVQEAIYHVLGIELSLNIALALAVGEQFKGPMSGMVGARAVWRQSVYCAVLSQSIASKIKNQPGLQPGMAYLQGLLHNIGFLMLGHLFPKKISAFNKLLESKPEICLSIHENGSLGVSHVEAGRLLMRSWALPETYEVVVQNHHNSGYSGAHEVYSHIIYLSNALLKSIGIGDAPDSELPVDLLKKYGLTEEALKEMLQIVLQWNASIDHLAHQLAA